MADPVKVTRYRTGEPVVAGDRVLFDGRPGTVTFVSQPDPASPLAGFTVTVRLDSGGGVQVAGLLPLPNLVLVSRPPADPGPA